LFEHSEFPGIPFKFNQSFHFEKYVIEILHHPITTKDFCILFQMSERTVRHNLLQGPQQPGRPSRHSAFDGQSETSLVEVLLGACQSGGAINKKHILQIVPRRHEKTLTLGLVPSLLDSWRLCKLAARSLRNSGD
jgi:hypothetical protein